VARLERFGCQAVVPAVIARTTQPVSATGGAHLATLRDAF
jgi:hypothetical protein